MPLQLPPVFTPAVMAMFAYKSDPASFPETPLPDYARRAIGADPALSDEVRCQFADALLEIKHAAVQVVPENLGAELPAERNARIDAKMEALDGTPGMGAFFSAATTAEAVAAILRR